MLGPVSETGRRSIITTFVHNGSGETTRDASPDAVTGANPGIGRPASILDRSGSTAFAADDRGSVTSERRTIATQAASPSSPSSLARARL